MRKSILLIGYNFYPEPTGIGKYSGEQIQWLAKKGYECSVLTSYPYYPFWKVQEPYVKDQLSYNTEIEQFDSGGSITVYRCPMYIPRTPSGLKRVLMDFSFLITAFFKLLQLLVGKKYDMVITILPSVTLGLLGIFYKKLRGTQLICHVHDLQIEAARDLKMIKSKNGINALFKLEKYIFDQCDGITCVGEGMLRKVREKAQRDISLFYNTTDLNQFYPMGDRGGLKQTFGFESSDKIALYSGAIGEKQGIEAILYSAKKFKNRKDLKFVICGSGPYKERLQIMASQLKLQNLSFMPLQPIENFNSFLNMADVHLIIQKANACDLVMPSKLNTVLAIGGVALVTANIGTGIYSLIRKHDMGVLVDAENQDALNEGILEALGENANMLAANARKYAETYLSVDKIMNSFEESFLLIDLTKEEHATSLT
jgi:colanic acid biosynthesis glycosyl transferase WcaI